MDCILLDKSYDRRIIIGVHKNIADMAIVAEGVELALTMHKVDILVITTNNGGFFPLMYKLVELGKKVYWIGGETPYKKAEILKEEVDRSLESCKLDELV